MINLEITRTKNIRTGENVFQAIVNGKVHLTIPVDYRKPLTVDEIKDIIEESIRFGYSCSDSIHELKMEKKKLNSLKV